MGWRGVMHSSAGVFARSSAYMQPQKSPTPCTRATTSNPQKSVNFFVARSRLFWVVRGAGASPGEGEACGGPRVAERARAQRLLEARAKDAPFQRDGGRETLPGVRTWSNSWILLRVPRDFKELFSLRSVLNLPPRALQPLNKEFQPPCLRRLALCLARGV